MLGVCVGIDAFFSALVVGPSRMTGYALSHSAEVTHPFIQPSLTRFLTYPPQPLCCIIPTSHEVCHTPLLFLHAEI